MFELTSSYVRSFAISMEKVDLVLGQLDLTNCGRVSFSEKYSVVRVYIF